MRVAAKRCARVRDHLTATMEAPATVPDLEHLMATPTAA
jgi:hypothetical protein